MRYVIESNKEKICHYFANDFISLAKETIKKNDKFCVSLSGGSTPKLFFRALVEINKTTQIPWDKIYFYWGDERCVPIDHSDSNYSMTKEYLFDLIKDIPLKNIFRIRGEVSPETEIIRYSTVISDHVTMKNDWPTFDLMILGMGNDGHTASIFPNSIYLLNDIQFCQKAIHPDTKQVRISLTGQVINRSRYIAFLVTGADKRDVLETIICKKKDWEIYPAAHINPIDGNLTWYLDEESSSGIHFPPNNYSN